MTLPHSQTTELDERVRDDDLPPADNPFFYGWLDVLKDADGNDIWEQIPMTLADVLHPQVMHHIPQGYKHSTLLQNLYSSLNAYIGRDQEIALVVRMLLDWEDEHIKPVSPDLAIVRDVQTICRNETFYLKQSRGHIDLIVEITDYNTWKIILEGIREPNKVQVYERAGVPLYIIIDCYRHEEGQTMQIIAYRLNDEHRYERIQPNDRGWYWIDALQLWIGPHKDTVSWYEPSASRMQTYLELYQTNRQAEEQARYEAEARQRAEEHAQREAEARQRAEEHAQREAEARQRAEERIRELEALLRKASAASGE